MKLRIEKLVYGGWGLARLGDETEPGSRLFRGKEKPGQLTVFVPDVIPGEEVQASIHSAEKGYTKANLLNVIDPSLHRVQPLCPLFGSCGGCHYQHIRYTAQLSFKQAILEETLWRIGRIRVPSLPIIPAPDPYHYRHRVQFKLASLGQGWVMGFYWRESHQVVPVEGCPVLHPRLEQAIKLLNRDLQEGLSFLHNPTEIHLQYSKGEDNILMVLFAEDLEPEGLGQLFLDLKPNLPVAGIVACTKNQGRIVVGRPYLQLSLKEMIFRVGDQTFTQPNWVMNECLVDHIMAYAQLKGSETVLDLYSGMGNFSLFLARQARRVIAVEDNLHAVKDARHNAKLNQVTNTEIHGCTVEKGLARLLKNPPDIDLALLDPPRQGAGKKVLEQIGKLGVSRILYLSCNPATLARDLRVLLSHGYTLGRIQPFDLFPQTYHLEVLAEVNRLPQVRSS